MLKKWAAPDYVLIWFDRNTARVRLTVEHVDPQRAVYLTRSGWREQKTKGGRYTRTVTCDDLPHVLATLGRTITA